MEDKRKTVLITGCTPPGIGYHLALAFHKQGYRVFATARSASVLHALAEQGIETLALTVDDEESVRHCAAEVEARVNNRGLDFLINNAGQVQICPATDMEPAAVRSLFAVNFIGVTHVNTVFAPLLVRARGTIAHVGSVAGKMPFGFRAAYGASKAALHAYGESLRPELAPFGVHVVNIIAGGVRSNIARTRWTIPPGSLWEGCERQFERCRTVGQTLGVPAEQFAAEVSRKLVRSRGWLWNTNEIWAGANAGLVWWVALLDRTVPGGLVRFVWPWFNDTRGHKAPPKAQALSKS